MAFSSYPQGHRLCILGEAKCFVFYISLGRGLLHPRGPDLFTKFARRPGCAGRRISNPDYSCFSLSKRRRAISPPPLFLHFVVSLPNHLLCFPYPLSLNSIICEATFLKKSQNRKKFSNPLTLYSIISYIFSVLSVPSVADIFFNPNAHLRPIMGTLFFAPSFFDK